MMKLATVAVFASAIALSPALAQMKAPSTASGTPKSAADCQVNFKAADRNNDGQLDKAEIDSSKIMVPTTVSTTGMVSMQDFVSACNSTVNTSPQK